MMFVFNVILHLIYIFAWVKNFYSSFCCRPWYFTPSLFLREMADSIQRKQEDLFLTRHSLMKLAGEAPVHPDMKKRLADPNDSEVVQSKFQFFILHLLSVNDIKEEHVML